MLDAGKWLQVFEATFSTSTSRTAERFTESRPDVGVINPSRHAGFRISWTTEAERQSLKTLRL